MMRKLVFLMVIAAVVVVVSVPAAAASQGCAELNNPDYDGFYNAPPGSYVVFTSFEAGETVSITGSAPWIGPSTTPPNQGPGYWTNFDAGETLEYTVPADGDYWFAWRGIEQDWEVSCTSPDTLFIDSDAYLDADYTGEIVILANDVTLDCAGHSVTPAVGSGPIGIHVSERTGVTITNCVVSGFDLDIFYFGSSWGTITNNVAFEASQGIALNTTDHTLVSGNEVYGTTTAGIGLADADDGNTITGNLAHDNDRAGIDLFFADNNKVIANTLEANGEFGVLLNQTVGNVVSGNHTSATGDKGFLLTGSSGATLKGNVAVGNNIGFFVENSEGNTLIENRADRNSLGFVLNDGSSGNTLRENTALHNDQTGFYLLGGSKDNDLVENVAKHNQIGFLFTESSSDNTVSENVGRTNKSWDAAQDLSSTNSYFENDFKKTVGF